MSTYTEVDELVAGAIYAARKLPKSPVNDQLIHQLEQVEETLSELNSPHGEWYVTRRVINPAFSAGFSEGYDAGQADTMASVKEDAKGQAFEKDLRD